MKQKNDPVVFYERFIDDNQNNEYRHHTIRVWIRTPNSNGETDLPGMCSDHYSFRYQTHKEKEIWKPSYGETLDLPSFCYSIRAKDFIPLMTVLKKMDRVQDKMQEKGVTFSLPIPGDDFYYRVALLKAIGAREIYWSKESRSYSSMGCFA